jgi:penicillin-binding protein 1C
MGDVSGVTGAGPLWAAVMDAVTGGTSEAPPDPPGWERRTTCALSGGAAGPHCDHRIDDWVPKGEGDRPTCAWHRADGVVDWPPELVSWAHDAGVLAECGGCAASGSEGIEYPAPNTVLYVDPRYPADHQQIPLRASSALGAARVEWSVDGRSVGGGKPGEPVLWRPDAAGAHTIALAVDGRPAGEVTVEIRGSP